MAEKKVRQIKAKVSAKKATAPKRGEITPARLLKFTKFRLDTGTRRKLVYDGTLRFDTDTGSITNVLGYNFHAQLNASGELVICAGCRRFNPSQAMTHWDPDDYHRVVDEANSQKETEQMIALAKDNIARCLNLFKQARNWVNKQNKTARANVAKRLRLKAKKAAAAAVAAKPVKGGK